MKLYNITIKNDDKKGKSLQVKVESYKEFLKWLELQRGFLIFSILFINAFPSCKKEFLRYE